MTNLYQQLILDEAKHPKNKGKLPHPDIEHEETNATCGDEIDVYLKVDFDQQIIKDIKWEGAGCIISQSHMSVLSEQVKGMKFDQVLSLDKADLLDLFHLETISPARVKCLMISLKSIQRALKKLTNSKL